jgi:hypothetical protein
LPQHGRGGQHAEREHAQQRRKTKPHLDTLLNGQNKTPTDGVQK